VGEGNPLHGPAPQAADLRHFAASATLVGLFSERPSVIFAASPPLPAGAVGTLLARRFRVPWALDVRDLWVDAAGSLGVVRSGRVARLAGRLEHGLYANAAAITVPTDAFGHHVGGGVDGDKVHLLPNGASEPCLSVGSQEVNRHPLGLPNDRFVWTFAGNLGLSQGFDAAIEAAGRLGAGFQLLLLGDGASRPHPRPPRGSFRPDPCRWRSRRSGAGGTLHAGIRRAARVTFQGPRGREDATRKALRLVRPRSAGCGGRARRGPEARRERRIAIAVPPEDPRRWPTPCGRCAINQGSAINWPRRVGASLSRMPARPLSGALSGCFSRSGSDRAAAPSSCCSRATATVGLKIVVAMTGGRRSIVARSTRSAPWTSRGLQRFS
jgi:Glycosyl transferase 4-like domain